MSTSIDPPEDRMSWTRLLVLALVVALASILFVSSATHTAHEAGKKWGRPVVSHPKSHRV